MKAGAHSMAAFSPCDKLDLCVGFSCPLYLCGAVYSNGPRQTLLSQVQGGAVLQSLVNRPSLCVIRTARGVLTITRSFLAHPFVRGEAPRVTRKGVSQMYNNNTKPRALKTLLSCSPALKFSTNIFLSSSVSQTFTSPSFFTTSS
jgi:hypothetical protein